MQQPLPTTLRSERPLYTIRVLWAINIVALIGLIAWIFTDGQFGVATDMLRARIAAVIDRGFAASAYTWYAGRVLALAVTGVLAAVSFVGIFLGLFFGAASHRRVRSWFTFTLLCAGWLTLIISWKELAWHSQVFRFGDKIEGYKTIADSLRDSWPTTDGERPYLGPFMAYPIGDPTMLMMLTSPTVPDAWSTFATVERGNNGTLRFELVGEDPGTWLEWHPPDSLPQSFAGGLENVYALDRYAPLGNDWYLARYKRGINISSAGDD